MRTSTKGIELIKSFEGCRCLAYKALPSEEYWTIGYGHYGKDVTQGMTITQEQAEEYLRKDLEKFEAYVDQTGITLNQNQYDALVSFAYNCGPKNLRRLTLGRTILQIPDAMLLYCKAGGKELKSLKRRREAERKLFLSEV